eukprot:1328115-Rhodomonas_salina.5
MKGGDYVPRNKRAKQDLFQRAGSERCGLRGSRRRCAPRRGSRAPPSLPVRVPARGQGSRGWGLRV